MKAAFTSLVVASVILLSSGAALAATTHYDSLALWEADVVDYTLEDFTDPDPLGLGYAAGPVTQYTGGVFTLFAGEGPVTIEFFQPGTTIPATVNAFSLLIKNGGDTTVSLYNENGDFLDSYTGTLNEFRGFVSAEEISSVVVSHDAGSNVSFDDMRFTTIPEPASLLISLLGGTLFCCYRRR